MATIGRLTVALSANSAMLVQEMEKAKRNVGSFVSEARRRVQSLNSVFNGLANVVKGVGAAILGTSLSFAGLNLLLNRTSDNLDAMAKHADKLGILPDKLQQIQFAAGLAGVATNELDTALQRMVRRIGSAAQTGGGITNTISQLGLSVQELVQMSPDEQLARIGSAINSLSTQSEKLAATFAIFDTGGATEGAPG